MESCTAVERCTPPVLSWKAPANVKPSGIAIGRSACVLVTMLTIVLAGAAPGAMAATAPLELSTTPPVAPIVLGPTVGASTSTEMTDSAAPSMTVISARPAATAWIRPSALTVTTP